LPPKEVVIRGDILSFSGEDFPADEYTVFQTFS